MLKRISSKNPYQSVRRVALNRINKLEKMKSSYNKKSEDSNNHIDGEEARKYWKDLYG